MGQPSKGQGAEFQADLQRQADRTARRLARPTLTQKDGAWRKPVHTPNSVTADAGMASVGARSNSLGSNPIPLAIDDAGNFGYMPSALNRLRQVFTYAGIPAFSSSTVIQVLTITWPKPFADSDYTITVDLVPPSGTQAMLTSHTWAKTPSGCSLTVYGGGATIPAGAVATVDGNHL